MRDSHTKNLFIQKEKLLGYLENHWEYYQGIQGNIPTVRTEV
jgi:hypothetical protein